VRGVLAKRVDAELTLILLFHSYPFEVDEPAPTETGPGDEHAETHHDHVQAMTFASPRMIRNGIASPMM